MGAGAADIAEIVSDVREQLPGLQPPPQLEADQARFRLFDSITAFLKSAGRRQPLVLILEDLQWAEHPSLLLEFLVRELAGGRLLLIGTYRDVDIVKIGSITPGEISAIVGEPNQRGSPEDISPFLWRIFSLRPPAPGSSRRPRIKSSSEMASKPDAGWWSVLTAG